jgi:acetyl-CoA acetyltransferase
MTQGLDHRDRCAITGIGATDFGHDSGRTPITLATQASLAAIADAGLTPADIDGVVHSDYDLVLASHVAHSMGLPNISYWGATGMGGAVRHGGAGGCRGAGGDGNKRAGVSGA